MHISHDFIATKTCPSYEVLVVSDRCGFETEKVRGEAGAGWDGLRGGCGLEVCKISQTSAGAGRA